MLSLIIALAIDVMNVAGWKQACSMLWVYCCNRAAVKKQDYRL